MESNLPFITEKKLEENVTKVIDKAKKSLVSNEKKFNRNSIDPFSALFDSLWQDIPMSEWVEQEKSRQNQKTLQNALGDFHQNLLGSMNGWVNLETGGIFDIKNDEKKIIAEIKNKHNTTKGNHKVVIYDDLKGQLDTLYKGYTAYYVEVIPKNKKTYNKVFIPSDNRTHTQRPPNDAIRVIDGKSFYALATGDDAALEKIYHALPTVIAKVITKTTGKTLSTAVADSTFKELFDKVY